MRIGGRTSFDCTATGVVGHYKPSQIPFCDATGRKISNLSDWNHSRNQQRNWETLLQIISLRCQPMDIRQPVANSGYWEFEFDTESPGVFGEKDFELLYADCQGVPMITGLTENRNEISQLEVTDQHRNIWFSTINIIKEIDCE